MCQRTLPFIRITYTLGLILIFLVCVFFISFTFFLPQPRFKLNVSSFRRRLIRLCFWFRIWYFFSLSFPVVRFATLMLSTVDFRMLVYWFGANGIALMLFDTIRLQRFRDINYLGHSPLHRLRDERIKSIRIQINALSSAIIHLFVTISQFGTIANRRYCVHCISY